VTVDPVGEWLDLAHQDLASAQFLLSMRPVPVEVICFHCQQAAEKFLKVVLNSSNLTIPKTHDLLVLLDLVRATDPKFGSLESPLADLNDFSVVVRYPAHLTLDETDAKKALIDAEADRSFVLTHLKK